MLVESEFHSYCKELQQDLKKLSQQKCPFCQTSYPIEYVGYETLYSKKMEPESIRIYEDRGFSRCKKCGIYFTKWENMVQNYYDDIYWHRYNRPELMHTYQNFGIYFFKINSYIGRDKIRFLDIGAISDGLLDVASQLKWETYGIDINKNCKSSHKFIIGDFEQTDFDIKFDVIWASHVFEHFHYPIKALQKCHNLLNSRGILFVAMPDANGIDNEKPHTWGNWWIKEHHIMWELESFVKRMEDVGFSILHKIHNNHEIFTGINDMHIMGQKN